MRDEVDLSGRRLVREAPTLSRAFVKEAEEESQLRPSRFDWAWHLKMATLLALVAGAVISAICIVIQG